MSSWRDEYIQALHERDEREKASYQHLDPQLIDAFTKLLERTAALEAEKVANTPSDASPRDLAQPATVNDGTAQLRADLAEAIRSNGRLQARVKVAETELAKTKALNKSNAKQIKDLTTERNLLIQRLRDKDEEIRGKAKVFHDTQDELISRDLELNMCEKQKKKLEAENKELIDRWMAHKGQQADEMNRTLHASPRGK